MDKSVLKFINELKIILNETKESQTVKPDRKGFGLTDSFSINDELKIIDDIYNLIHQDKLSIKSETTKIDKSEIYYIISQAKSMIKIIKKIKLENENIDETISRAIHSKNVMLTRLKVAEAMLTDAIDKINDLKNKWNKMFCING